MTVSVPRRRRIVAVLTLALTACSGGSGKNLAGPPGTTATPLTRPATTSTTLDPDAVALDGPLYLAAFGPVVAGMPYADAEKATKRKVTVTDRLHNGGRCVDVSFAGQSPDIAFSGSNGKVVRFEVKGRAAVATRSGIAIGTDRAKVLAAYGARISSHPGIGGQENLVYTPTDKADLAYELIVVVDRSTKKVVSMRSGFKEFVDLPEGCV